MTHEKSSTVSSLVAAKMKRPGLGDWCSLLESLLADSTGSAGLLHPHTPADLLKSRPDYLDEFGERLNSNQALSAMSSLRNMSTGHGALQTLYEYKQMVDNDVHRLYSFLNRVEFFAINNSFLVLTSQYDEFGDGDRYKIRVFRGLSISDSDLETSNRLSEGQGRRWFAISISKFVE